MTEGYHKIHYYVTYSEITSSSLVNFTIDTTPPIISALSVENKTYYTTEIPLGFAVNEPTTQVTYCLDGQENVTIAGNTTLTNLPFGEHNVIVYATDKVGNSGASETIIFNVAKPPELFPKTLLATASVATVAIIGVGLLVYFKKRKR